MTRLTKYWTPVLVLSQAVAACGGSEGGGNAAGGASGSGATTADDDALTGGGGQGTTPGASGQSGDTGSPLASLACDSFEPCGGDPTGVWDVVDACSPNAADVLASDLEPSGCEGALREVAVDTTGTVELTEDGRSETDLVNQFELTLAIDQDCLGALGEELGLGSGTLQLSGATCGLVPVGIEQMPDPPERTTCEMSGVECLCDAASAEVSSNTGTYEVDGDNLATPQGDLLPFCQSDDQMLIQVESEGGVQIVMTLERR